MRLDLSLLMLTLAACSGGEDKAEDTGTPLIDVDGDGFFANSGDELEDCDDTSFTVNPAADELCDDVDNDCDGAIDEEAVDRTTWYRDNDGDGYGDDDTEELACDQPLGFLDQPGDCDDANPLVNPEAIEVCDEDRVDEDCDGGADDRDPDMDPEVAGQTLWYVDADVDEYGDAEDPGTWACHDPSGAVDVYVQDATDCDDTDEDVNPGVKERCDEDDLDEDCDGLVDDADDDVQTSTQEWWAPDADGDGYGDLFEREYRCDAPESPKVDWVKEDTDCDDTRDDVNPGATEVCDEDDTDEDCDGYSDDSDSDVDSSTFTTWYADQDGDGYGNASLPSSDQCDAPTSGGRSYVDNADDCDDRGALVNPGEAEICDPDDIDEDCSGASDDDDPGLDTTSWLTWYLDADEDGYGDASSTTQACNDPSTTGAAYVDSDEDCDDDESSTYPGASETCDDGVDSDCDDLDDTCQQVDLDDGGLAWEGEGASHQAGFSLSSGDLDDDGQIDLIIGAVSQGDGGPAAGAAYVARGTSSGVQDLGSAWQLTGPSSGALAGNSVAVLDDADGDGVNDLIIAGYGATDTASGQGAAWLLLGPITADLDLDDAEAIAWGEAASDQAGYRVAHAGDPDDDGMSEWLMGAMGSDRTGTDGGAVYLLEGTISGDVDLGEATAIFESEYSSDRAGSALAGGEDVDGDGIDDLLLGAYSEDTSSTNAGAAYLWTGAASGTLSLADATAKVVGRTTNNALGSSAHLADLDGDGAADLVLGAHGDSTSGTDAGGVFVFYGAPSGTVSIKDADASVFGEGAGDKLGWSVSTADVNGDGQADLVMGAHGYDGSALEAGRAYVVLGPLSGTHALPSGDGLVDGLSASQNAGYAVHGVDDLDGDGLDELLLGAPGDDLSGGGRGAAILLTGSELGY